MFWQLDDLSSKSCVSCDKPLIREKPEVLICERGEWYHEVCLLRAKRAYAQAMKLARLGYAIQEYIAYRENTDTPT